MKILLWKVGALGDVLMTTPLVRQLRKALPDAQIDYLVGQSCATILQGNPHLDQVIGFDERILYDARIAGLGAVLRPMRGYDAVFVLDKHWVFSLLAWRARIPRRVGFARRVHEGLMHSVKVRYGPLKHEIHYYLALAQAHGIAVDMLDVRLELPASEPVALPPRYSVLINSGGVNPNEQSEVRKMPAALFGELVAAFKDRAHVVFLGAPGEHTYYEQFASAATTNLCGKTSLKQAWHALEHAQSVYTTDCGLMHMAGALNRNVTAIFGPTHPARKCPPSARWVWADQDRYDSGYEVFGRLPRGAFFERMTLAHILDDASPRPLQELAP